VPLNHHDVTHLQGENTVALCTGLRKTRMKLKENKVEIISTRISLSLSCAKIEDLSLEIEGLHVIPEKLR
jgi:hypothetical protein